MNTRELELEKKLADTSLLASAKPYQDMSDGEWQARIRLAAAYRLLAHDGFRDLTYNHLSLRVPGAADRYLVKGQAQLFEQVTASSLVLYDFDGRKLRESPYMLGPAGHVIHGGVYKARPDVMAVFHTHSVANMAVSVQSHGLLPLTQHAMVFHKRLSYHAFKGFEFEEQGRERLVQDLGSNYAMLLRNHGALVCGRTLAEAYFFHHYLEMSCRTQIAALSAGADKLELPDAQTCDYASRQFDAPIMDEGRDWVASFDFISRLAPDLAR